MALSLVIIGCEDKEKKQSTQLETTAETKATVGTVSDSSETAKTENQTPWITSAEMIEEGKRHYKINCAVCHGAEGKGDGVAGKGLNPRPRNFVADAKWKNKSTAQGIFQTISTGIPGSSMVGFKQLSPQVRWSLVHYIRSIAKKPQSMNPKALETFGVASLKE